MSVRHFFELICDRCKTRFEDIHERALFTPGQVRAAAKKAGWKRSRAGVINFHNNDVDLCASCSGEGGAA